MKNRKKPGRPSAPTWTATRAGVQIITDNPQRVIEDQNREIAGLRAEVATLRSEIGLWNARRDGLIDAMRALATPL